MLIPIEYDPEAHEIIECDVGKHLRREAVEAGFHDLVVYRHRVFNTFVVAFRTPDKRELAEFAMLGTGAGEGAWISKPNRDRIVRMMRHLVPAKENQDNIRSYGKAVDRFLAEDDMAYRRGIQEMHRYIKRTQGEVKADRYQRLVGSLATNTEGIL